MRILTQNVLFTRHAHAILAIQRLKHRQYAKKQYITPQKQVKKWWVFSCLYIAIFLSYDRDWSCYPMKYQPKKIGNLSLNLSLNIPSILSLNAIPKPIPK